MADDRSAEELERARRARLIGETRADVARWKAEKKNREKLREEIERLPPTDLSRRLIPAAADDCVKRWAADAAKREREREQAEAELFTRSGPADLIYKRYEGAQPVDATRSWVEWVDGRIDAAIEAEREATTEGFGEAIGKILEDERRDVLRTLRGEIADLKIEASRLAAEVAELRVQLAQHSIDRAKVVDMPSPLSRRVN